MHKILEYSFFFTLDLFTEEDVHIDPLIRGGHTALAAGPWSLANTTPSTYFTVDTQVTFFPQNSDFHLQSPHIDPAP